MAEQLRFGVGYAQFVWPTHSTILYHKATHNTFVGEAGSIH